MSNRSGVPFYHEAFFHKAELLTARDAWCTNPTEAAATYGPIGTWDVSRITDLSFVFCGSEGMAYKDGDCNNNCANFNDDVSGWDVSKARSLMNTFAAAKAFNQPLNEWNTARVRNMDCTFCYAEVFNQPLNSWDTSKVTDMEVTFLVAREFNQPLDNWDTSRITNLRHTFAEALDFNQPLNNWNTAGVTQMTDTFWRTQAFNQPLNNWNTARVTNLRRTFSEAQAFNQPLDKWNIANVDILDNTFTDPTTGASALSDENKALIASTWSSNSQWCFSAMASWGGCPSGPAIILGALVVVGACVGYMVKMWLRKRKAAADRGIAGNQNATVPMQQAVPAATTVPMQQAVPVAAAVPTQQVVPVVAAVPTQQPAASNVMVTCPPGLKPGDSLQVAGPGGQTVQVQVPAGVTAGGQFMVQMPALPVTAATPMQSVTISRS